MIAVQDDARPRAARDADDHAGARRARVRGARGRARRGRARRCRASWPASRRWRCRWSPRSASAPTGTRRTEPRRRATGDALPRRGVKPEHLGQDLFHSRAARPMVRHRIRGRATARPRSIVRTARSQVENVSVRFGGIVALDRRVVRRSPRGQIVGLIGPNGAGKTTLFNCLSRLYAFSEGAIALRGPLAARDAAARHRRARHRPHVPEPGAVPDHDRAPEHPARRPLPHRAAASSPTRCACRACGARKSALGGAGRSR